jgi:hypothetical protein
MGMKKRFSLRGRSRRKKGDTTELAKQLAPLEEQDKRNAAKQISIGSPGDPQADSHYGAIVVENDSLHAAKDIMETGNEKTFLGIEPVVLVIVGVMLAFIAFIAWQISQMPSEMMK